uniref:Uncharacterized protein n=1 Tax=viral metagenome TaxID=1070528 RepID=A0A6M3LT87_9ZZZZ
MTTYPELAARWAARDRRYRLRRTPPSEESITAARHWRLAETREITDKDERTQALIDVSRWTP